MREPDPPKIEFPCQYPIKVLGRSVEQFDTTIFTVFETHAPGFDRNNITRNISSKGTFSSMTVTITATGTDQLEALHRGLMATGIVKMVI